MDKRLLPHSEEHKKKISLAHKAKGNNHWSKRVEVREKMRQAKLKNPTNYWLGKHRSQETKEKLRKSIAKVVKRGSDCNFWKDGSTSLMDQIRHSVEFREWRDFVYKRDNYICSECKQIGNKLNAHHIVSFASIVHKNKIKTIEEARNCYELWDINNGVTLCYECHKKTESFLVNIKK